MTKYTGTRHSPRVNRVEKPEPAFTSISFIIGTLLQALVLFAAAALLPNAANAQVVITESRAIDFSTVASSGDAGGSIILGTDGSTTSTGAAVKMSGQSRSGSFTVTGAKNQKVILTLPSAPVQITGGGSTATVHSFVSNPPAGTSQSLGGNGRLTFLVGATLDLSAGQLAADYAGTYSIFADPI